MARILACVILLQQALFRSMEILLIGMPFRVFRLQPALLMTFCMSSSRLSRLMQMRNSSISSANSIRRIHLYLFLILTLTTILQQEITPSGTVPVTKERLKVACLRKWKPMMVLYRAHLRSGILTSTSTLILVLKRCSIQVWQYFQVFLLHIRTATGHSRLLFSVR